MNIFISYSRHNQSIAEDIAGDIESLGHIAWFDHALSGGQSWWNEILERIRNCEVFLFVLTLESLDSTACTREFGYAADLGKNILPILVADNVSTKLLPPALSEIQLVDYRRQDRSSAFELARALTSLPGARALPDPLPPPPEAPVSYLGTLAEQIASTDTLNYDTQSALFIDLKRGLRNPETIDDSLTLIENLRNRRDLYVVIADEIDALPQRTQSSRSASLAKTGSRLPATGPADGEAMVATARPQTASRLSVTELEDGRSSTPAAPAKGDSQPFVTDADDETESATTPPTKPDSQASLDEVQATAPRQHDAAPAESRALSVMVKLLVSVSIIAALFAFYGALQFGKRYSGWEFDAVSPSLWRYRHGIERDSLKGYLAALEATIGIAFVLASYWLWNLKRRGTFLLVGVTLVNLAFLFDCRPRTWSSLDPHIPTSYLWLQVGVNLLALVFVAIAVAMPATRRHLLPSRSRRAD